MIVEINDNKYNVKVITSKDDMSKGLQGITELPKDEGLLFVFDEPQTVKKSSKQSSGLIFANIMKEIHNGLEKSTFKQPDGIVSATGLH